METYTEVFVWGSNSSGQLGLGQQAKDTPKPVFCSYNIRIKQIACGTDHAALVSYNGLAYAMGSNADGKLGIANRKLKHSYSPLLIETLASAQAAAVACGASHSLALTADGAVYAWGQGEFGALGVGSVASQCKPVRVNAFTAAVAISCGGRHSAVLDENGVFVFGAGESGQLATGRREREPAPVQLPLKDIRQIACGETHTLFLTQAGKVLATGSNTTGQLGTGSKKATTKPRKVNGLDAATVEFIAAGTSSACIADTGDLYLWGKTALGEALSPTLLRIGKVRTVSVGSTVACAISITGRVHAWGYNSRGELGQGNTEECLSVVRLDKLASRHVRELQCGGGFVLALGEDVRPRTLSEKQLKTVRPTTPCKGKHTIQLNSRNNSVARKSSNVRTPRSTPRHPSEQRKTLHTNNKHSQASTDKMRTALQQCQEALDRKTRQVTQLEEHIEHLVQQNPSGELNQYRLQLQEQTDTIASLRQAYEQLKTDYTRLQADHHQLQEVENFRRPQALSDLQVQGYRERVLASCRSFRTPVKAVKPEDAYADMPCRRVERPVTPSRNDLQTRINDLLTRHEQNKRLLAELSN